MIILPATPPMATYEQNSVNQSQLNHSRSLEDSRIATDTVKISAEAQQLAGSLVNDKPSGAAPDPARVQATEAKQALQHPPQAELPKNPVTQAPEGNRIDVVS